MPQPAEMTTRLAHEGESETIMANCSPWQAVRRLLCVRLDSMGDVFMTTPALRALKNLPASPKITLLTSAGGVAAAKLVPEVDDVWCAEVAWLKHTPLRTSAEEDRQLIERIRQAEFDACVIFTVLTQSPLPSAMLCYLADIPLRLAHCRENPYQLLTDWVIDTETLATARHEVRRQLDLVKHVGATTRDERLSLRISPAARAETLAWLAQHEFLRHEIAQSQPWCVLHPGATAASRRYSVESYAQVASLLERAGFRLIITGSAHERPLIDRVLQACTRSLAFPSHYGLEQVAALIQQAPVLLSNNTGPVHIAAAVGTPVVDLYALTNPQHTPWQVAQRVLYHDVPCRNCLKSVCPAGHHDCLRLVTPECVARNVIELWQTTSTARLSISCGSIDEQGRPENLPGDSTGDCSAANKNLTV